jgi:hypothetical protein
MKQKLPSELILEILKIKSHTAITSRLEKILKFPRYDTEENDFYIVCGGGFVHRWKFQPSIDSPRSIRWYFFKIIYDFSDFYEEMYEKVIGRYFMNV